MTSQSKWHHLGYSCLTWGKQRQQYFGIKCCVNQHFQFNLLNFLKTSMDWQVTREIPRVFILPKLLDILVLMVGMSISSNWSLGITILRTIPFIISAHFTWSSNFQMKIEGGKTKEKINRRIPTTDFHLSLLYWFFFFIIMQYRVHLFLIHRVIESLQLEKAYMIIDSKPSIAKFTTRPCSQVQHLHIF